MDRDRLELVARVLDLLPDFFYVHNYEMRFQYANARAARYFGFETQEALIGRLLVDVDPDSEQARRFAGACRAVMDAGEPRLTSNLEYRRSDGTMGVLRQHDIPFIGTDGGKYIMGLSRDVTDERDLERERVQRATLLREMEIARQIQSALQPPPPKRETSLDVAGFSEPAVFAGGDYYDWGFSDEGLFGGAIGDVTGHGVGSALIAATCRAYARVLAETLPLADFLPRLNAWLSRDLSAGRFVTCAAWEVDPQTGRGWIVSAGHGPMYVVRVGRGGGEGTIEELPTHLLPLGVDDQMEVAAPTEFTLGPGDRMVLVSDGVFECQNSSGEQFGLGRLREVLTRTVSLGADEQIAATVAEVRKHASGRAFDDDVTMVVVGMKGG